MHDKVSIPSADMRPDTLDEMEQLMITDAAKNIMAPAPAAMAPPREPDIQTPANPATEAQR